MGEALHLFFCTKWFYFLYSKHFMFPVEVHVFPVQKHKFPERKHKSPVQKHKIGQQVKTNLLSCKQMLTEGRLYISLQKT